MHGVRAFCFDLDGLMVDSEPLHFEAQRRMLARRGVTYTLEDKQAVTGGVVRESVRKAARQYGLTDVDEMYRERMATFTQLIGQGLELRPGVRDLLARLKARRVPCAVVTSGEREYLGWVLDRFNLEHFFTKSVAAEDVTRHKPEPEPYLKAASALRMAPEHCVALEDSRNGLLSAKAAGMWCVVVPNVITMNLDFSLADGLYDSLEDLDERFLDRVLGE